MRGRQSPRYTSSLLYVSAVNSTCRVFCPVIQYGLASDSPTLGSGGIGSATWLDIGRASYGHGVAYSSSDP